MTNKVLTDLAQDQLIDRVRQGPVALDFHGSRTSGTLRVYAGRHNGRPLWIRVGTWPAMDPAEVVRNSARLLAQHATGGDLSASPAGFTTVADMLGWYEARAAGDAGLSDSRRAQILTAIRLHLRPKLGVEAWPPAKSVIDKLLVGPLNRAGAKDSTIKAYLGVLKSGSAKAAAAGYQMSDPLSDISFRSFIDRRVHPKDGALARHHLPTVLHAISESSTIPAGPRMLALMALLHGTRLSETARAKWSDIDWQNRVWHIPAANTKTKRTHRIPLTDLAISLLQSYRDHCPPFSAHIFPPGRGEQSDSGPICQRTRGTWISAVASPTKIKWSAHDLRKVARTVWSEIGVDYHIAELLLNHAPKGLDEVYIKTQADQQKRIALERWHAELARQCPSLGAALGVAPALQREVA